MRSSTPRTPLLALLRGLSDAQRQQLADDAGTSVSYLYALATCQRQSTRALTAKLLADATVKLHRETNGTTTILTMDELATMCTCCDK